MSEEIVGQSGHSGEALYNILPSTLSKRRTAYSPIIVQSLTTSQTTKAIATIKSTVMPAITLPTYKKSRGSLGPAERQPREARQHFWRDHGTYYAACFSCFSILQITSLYNLITNVMQSTKSTGKDGHRSERGATSA